MNKWICGDTYNPEDYTGFVYKITNLTNGKFYIGKKSFFHNTNVKLGKKEEASRLILEAKNEPKGGYFINEDNAIYETYPYQVRWK